MALTSYLYTQLVTKVRVTKGDSDLDANRARNIPVFRARWAPSSLSPHFIDPRDSRAVSTTKYDSNHMRVPGEHTRPGCSVRNYLEQIVWQTLR